MLPKLVFVAIAAYVPLVHQDRSYHFDVRYILDEKIKEFKVWFLINKMALDFTREK